MKGPKVSLKRGARTLYHALGGRRPTFIYEKDASGKVVASSSRNWFPGYPEQEPEEPYAGTTGDDLRPELHGIHRDGDIDDRTRVRATWILINRVKRGTDKGARDHAQATVAPMSRYHATFWYLATNIDVFCTSLDQRLGDILTRGGVIKWLRFDMFRPRTGYTMDRSGKVKTESQTETAKERRERRRRTREEQERQKSEAAERVMQRTREALEKQSKEKAHSETRRQETIVTLETEVRKLQAELDRLKAEREALDKARREDQAKRKKAREQAARKPKKPKAAKPKAGKPNAGKPKTATKTKAKKTKRSR